jgi:DNA-binding transcriptional ArsR family regulator
MKCPSYNLFFETISPRIRIKILELLKNKAMSVTEIASAMNEEQSKISHNLIKLKECHLLDVKQQGKKRIYSLNKDTMVPIMKLVDKHVRKYCCKECKAR